MRCFEKLIIYVKHLIGIMQFENLPLIHTKSAGFSLTITFWYYYHLLTTSKYHKDCLEMIEK